MMLVKRPQDHIDYIQGVVCLLTSAAVKLRGNGFYKKKYIRSVWIRPCYRSQKSVLDKI